MAQRRFSGIFPATVTFIATTAGVGCSSTPNGVAIDDGDAGVDSFVAAPSCTATSACDGTNDSDHQCVKTVTVSFVDDENRSVPNFSASVCGKDLCTYGTTDDTGKLRSGTAPDMALCRYMVSPALKVLGGRTYVSFASLVQEENPVYPAITLISLPGSGASFTGTDVSQSPQGMDETGNFVVTQPQDVNSGPAKLSFPAGTHVQMDNLTNSAPIDQLFRATAVPTAKAPPAVDASLGLERIYGLSPIETYFATPVTLTLPNDGQLAAGTKVDFFVHGIDAANETIVTYGGWAAMGTGHVSEDAATISTDPGDGNGLRVLSLIGLRKTR